jgi:hypothetical protein
VVCGVMCPIAEAAIAKVRGNCAAAGEAHGGGGELDSC